MFLPRPATPSCSQRSPLTFKVESPLKRKEQEKKKNQGLAFLRCEKEVVSEQGCDFAENLSLSDQASAHSTHQPTGPLVFWRGFFPFFLNSNLFDYLLK